MTAETAVVMPTLVFLTALLVWGGAAVVAQVQCVDAARVGARAAARGEERQLVLRAARSAAPEDAEVSLAREGDLLRVRVRARSSGPGPLTLPVRAEAVARAEGAPARLPGASGDSSGGAAARER
ncbi:TadE family type IV pilus minor pilin [Streptomyces sp. JJ36]|uniref:TadE family type IV pilus minor pilin n=1 Tax=Streptomyces sp. JJ36 TaxID=2736645 RepID=UPI001F489CE9|nr:TadE family type IV pilus minor pilin [Streptomyces sp. JJ36]MCF6522580.1 pilus assembly protein [Streptomyces sp. JJ36]